MGLSSVYRLANVIAGDNAAWRGRDSEARRLSSSASSPLHVSMFVNGVFDSVCRRSAASLRRPASAFSQPLFTFIYTQFLLLYDSAVVFRELGFVREMRTEVGEELKTGRAALGGARRVRLEKPPA